MRLAAPRDWQIVDVGKDSGQELLRTPNHILVGNKDAEGDHNDGEQRDDRDYVLHLHHILVVRGEDEQDREHGAAHKDDVSDGEIRKRIDYNFTSFLSF